MTLGGRGASPKLGATSDLDSSSSSSTFSSVAPPHRPQLSSEPTTVCGITISTSPLGLPALSQNPHGIAGCAEWPVSQLVKRAAGTASPRIALIAPEINAIDDTLALAGGTSAATVRVSDLRSALSTAFALYGIHDPDGIRADIAARCRLPGRERTYDAIVVLGAAPLQDGSIHPDAISRVAAVAELAYYGIAAPLILTGRSPESWQLEDEIRRQVDPTLPLANVEIVHERNSRNTYENFLFTISDILIPRTMRSVLLVTSSYHVERVKLLAGWAARYGISFSVLGSTDDHMSQDQLSLRFECEAYCRQKLQTFLARKDGKANR